MENKKSKKAKPASPPVATASPDGRLMSQGITNNQHGAMTMTTENTSVETTTETIVAAAPTGSKNKKTGLAYQDIVDMMDRVLDEKFDVQEQAAFLKVKGPNGHRLYIARQADVGRIDISFEPDPAIASRDSGGLIALRKPNGTVLHELDTRDASALSRLEALLQWMKDAPAVPTKKKTAFVPSLPAVAQKKAVSPETAQADREARRAKIEEFARQRGVDVSPNAKL